jgi:hypothetical protein
LQICPQKILGILFLKNFSIHYRSLWILTKALPIPLCITHKSFWILTNALPIPLLQSIYKYIYMMLGKEEKKRRKKPHRWHTFIYIYIIAYMIFKESPRLE